MTDLTPEARAEIAAAIKILRDDGLHVHRTYTGFLKTQQSQQDKPADTDDNPEGKPPPVKPEPTQDDKPKKKRGIGVWGNHDS